MEENGKPILMETPMILTLRDNTSFERFQACH
jgi:hypothetical protein